MSSGRGGRSAAEARLRAPLVALYRRLLGADVFMLAASIAYASLLSLFPLLLGLIALLSQFVARGHAQEAIVAALGPYLPPSALAMVRQTLNTLVPARGAGTLATVGLFWGATAAASAMRHSLNRILRIPSARAFWRRKLVELAMVLSAGGFLSVSLLASSVWTVVSTLPPLAVAAEFLPASALVAAAAAIGPWIFTALAFLILYRFLPNERLPGRSVLAGVLTGVLLFQGVERVFFQYLRVVAAYPPVYGSIAGVVVFMVWVYLVALIVLLGAGVAAEAAPGRRVTPDA